jgi:putative ABC transport system permease protein
LMESAQDETRQILRARRRVRPGQPDDFFLGTKQSLMAFWAALSSVFFVAFIVVSGITALVAGIVIMNVMLVSVTERAREIGLRRALGASQGDIRRQFLTESLLQCLVGGAVGVGVGFAAADLVEGATAFPVRVELWMVAAGLVFSSAIGLVFGLAPALSAARLDPVEALRSE